MAENTAMRNNALPYPVYGVPYVLALAMFDSDGNPKTSCANLDSEISKNGDTMADAGVEAEVGNGMYSIAFSAAEMTADVISGVLKTSTADVPDTPFTLYPKKLVILRSGTAQGGAAGYITLDASAGTVDDIWNGCLCVADIDGTVEARIIDDYDGTNEQASVTPNWVQASPDSDDTFVIYLPSGMQVPMVVDAIMDERLTGATHNVPTSFGRRMRGLGEFGGYMGGAIWIDTVNGSSGTSVNDNGISTAPVDNINDANTLAANGELKIVRFEVAPLSSFTFAEDQDGDVFHGVHWTLALGGRSISNTIIIGADVSGTGTGASQSHLDNCAINAVTLTACHLHNSILKNTFTVSATGTYHFLNLKCITAAVVNFGSAVGSTTVIIDDFSGDLEVQYIKSGDVLFIEGTGKLTVNANCTGGTIYIRGNIELSDSGAATINQDARVASVGVPVSLDSGTATIAGMLAEMADGATELTFDATTDSLAALYDKIVTATAGVGGNTITFTITNVIGGAAIADVVVAAYNSANTELQAHGTTNASGVVALNLIADTYTIRLRKQGSFTAANKTLVVSATAAQAYTMSAFSPSAGSANTSTIYGYLKTPSNSAIELTDAVWVRPKNPGEASAGGYIRYKDWTKVDTNSSGYFELELIEDEVFEIHIPILDKTFTITVPTGDTALEDVEGIA